MNDQQGKKTILVVGGAGYIGSLTTHYLASSNYRPIVLDNFSKGHHEFLDGFEVVEADVTDLNGLNEVFDRYKIDAVVHFAALSEVGSSMHHPIEYYRTNVGGTINLLQAMGNARVRKLVFSSSAAVYGNPVAVPISEKHALAPINPYGRTKVMMEQIIADAEQAWGLSWVALRYFNAAGADPLAPCGEWHDPETHLIPNLLLAAAGKKDNLQLFGTDHPTDDGTAVRDYVHVADLARAHISALRYMDVNAGGRVFNLGIGKGFSVREVIRSAKEVTGTEFGVVEADARKGDPAVLLADPSVAVEELRWRPEYTGIDEIVRSAWDWYMKHGFKPVSS